MLRTWPVRLRGHEVDVVGQVLPRAGHAGHLRLPAELAFGADLARHAGHLGGEGVVSWSTIVLMVFFSSRISPRDVDGDLAGQVAARDGRGHVGDVADLGRQVATPSKLTLSVRSFHVPATPSDVGLAAELAFGADLARHARDLAGERVELVDHRVDGVLQLQDLAADVDRDLLTEVAVGDGGRDLRRCRAPARSGCRPWRSRCR